MQKDRDDKYEGHEDSEYHFTDDELNYDVEAEEEPKPAAATKTSTSDLMQRLTSSKRMIISLAVFLILIFIVYRMVAPTTTTTPSTEIAPVTQAPPAVQTQAAPTQVPVQAPVQTPVQPQVAAPPVTPPVVQAPVTPAPAATTVPVSPEQLTTQTTIPTSIPVPERTVTPAQLPPNAEAAASALTSEAQREMSAIQADYADKVTAFENQNKALQSEVQTLNDRIGKMERQINQLVQVLTRQQTGATKEPETIPATEAKARGMRIGYTVQAIIPGRAWLRSDDGDTVTVTEGDVIKNVGRVTKIDPYDGIVDINVGDHVISLSYGNDGG